MTLQDFEDKQSAKDRAIPAGRMAGAEDEITDLCSK